jgi:transposase
MLYVGIDIGKRNHEATILDKSGKELCESIKFSNSNEGVDKLLSQIKNAKNATFSLEATGHYWLPLYCNLVSKNLNVLVLNPIQSDSLRNMYIRKTKTDKKDSFIIADILRIGRFPASGLANEEMIKLQTLSRLRFEFIDQVTGLKNRLVAVLDRIFPEYESIFSNVFIKSSKELLRNTPTPEEILEFDISELAEVLKIASKGRFGTPKAKEVLEKASNSFGITIALDAFALELKLLLAQIEFIEEQIKQIDSNVKELMKNIKTFITTIPGIGDVLGASILAEIGDISRFSSPKKLVAYAGLDSSIHASGQFVGSRSKISKRGSPYLRRALWSVAVGAKKANPVLADFYQRKIEQGKHPQAAVGACARKLTHLIYYILKERKPFDPNYQWNSNTKIYVDSL